MPIFKRKPEERSTGDWFPVFTPNARRVSPREALKTPAVASAVRTYSSHLSTTPLRFYRGRTSTSPGTLVEPRALALVDSIERGIGLGAWLGQIGYALATDGNSAYRIDALDASGKPLSISGVRDWGAPVNGFWVLDSETVPDRLVLAIRGVSWAPGFNTADSPLVAAAQAISAQLSSQEYADSSRGGGVPVTILKNNSRVLTAAESSNASEAAYSAMASGKPFVHGRDWETIFPNAGASTQLGAVELMRATADQIAAIYGLDPREIGGNGPNGLQYSTDTSRQLAVANAMRPVREAVARQISSYLPDDVTAVFDVDDVLLQSPYQQAQTDEVLIRARIYTPEEIRLRRGLPAVPVVGTLAAPTPATPVAADPQEVPSAGD